MTLTKEWLQKQITDLEATRDEIPFGLDEDGSNTLAALKMALAGMETKHNSVIAEQLDHVLSVMDVTAHQRAVISCAVDRLNKSAELLQQSPQPLTTSERAELENYRNAQQVLLKDHQIRELVNELRDIAVEYHGTQQLRERIARAIRAVMLQGADGKPELTVSYGPMPESNGKTNWTAILHRKGEGMLDGITIDRSEYPGRVLYAADRARYLIGEKPDRPFIIDYDTDKHSGYVAPGKADGNSPVIPDGW